MTIYDIEIDGKYYKIVDIRKSFLNSDELKICGGKKTYIPLVIALLQRITEKQLKAISKNNIIIIEDLARCFTYRPNHYVEGDNCICGVEITETNFIENVETGEPCIIGNKCITNWTTTPKELDKVNREIKKRKYNKNNNENI